MSADRIERDRTTALMSIRAQYADTLMAGVKRWEFRRQPLPPDILRVLVYRSGAPSVRGVIGHFGIGAQHHPTLPDLAGWKCMDGYGPGEVNPEFGISLDDLADYVKPAVAVWAIVPSRPIPFPEPIPLSAYGITASPQSWVYAPVGWRDIPGGGPMTPRRAEDLPPELLDALRSIPAGRHLKGEERRRAVTAVGTAYHDHGLTLTTVATLTPRSYGSVKVLAAEASVPIRRPGAPRGPRKPQSSGNPKDPS